MPVQLLVFNCGSSSLNYKLYRAGDGGELSSLASGKAHHVSAVTQEAAYLVHRRDGLEVRDVRPLPNHRTAAAAILAHLQGDGLRVDGIGHRIVNGGAVFQQPVLVDEQTLQKFEGCLRLAPLHNPHALAVMLLCREELPGVPQYMAFDTAFHATLPEAASRYALPLELADRLGFRKFGFHGLSYQYVARQASRALGRPLEQLKMVACHLGTGGSSVAAIDGGRSVETSMGYTPLAGLIMSTRTGDIDPAVVIELIGEHGYGPEQVDRLLNGESGLLGVSGISSNLVELIRLAEGGGYPRARLAVDMYVHRLKLYIGGYAAILAGLDALVFTDDVGVRAWQVRERVCAGLAWCGVELDPDANRNAPADMLIRVSAPGSRVGVLSIPTDEEYVVAREGLALL
jgi:acetate kinase